MLQILNLVPRWLLAALVAMLAATSCKLKWDNGQLYIEIEKGKTHVASLETSIARANEASAAQAAANERRAREAESAAKVREQRLVADSGRARAELDRLRSALSSYTGQRLTASPASIAPGIDPAAPIDDLLTVSQRYVELAEKCDRHVSDIQTLVAAWPK